jgi:DNA repair exonuclease SbcCD ATPase subunit
MEFLDKLDLDGDLKNQLELNIKESMQQAIDAEVKGLKTKNDELLGKFKSYEQQKMDAEQQAKQLAEAKAKTENDYKQLFESQKNETEQYKQQLNDMNKNIVKQKLGTEAAKLAGRLTKDTGKAELLQEQISRRLTLVDNEIRVSDASGQLTVSTLDELESSIRSSYPFLVDGVQSQGGGAVRSDSKAETTNKISRANFDSMGQGQRAEFVKSGGKIYDDI